MNGFNAGGGVARGEGGYGEGASVGETAEPHTPQNRSPAFTMLPQLTQYTARSAISPPYASPPETESSFHAPSSFTRSHTSEKLGAPVSSSKDTSTAAVAESPETERTST